MQLISGHTYETRNKKWRITVRRREGQFAYPFCPGPLQASPTRSIAGCWTEEGHEWLCQQISDGDLVRDVTAQYNRKPRAPKPPMPEFLYEARCFIHQRGFGWTRKDALAALKADYDKHPSKVRENGVMKAVPFSTYRKFWKVSVKRIKLPKRSKR